MAGQERNISGPVETIFDGTAYDRTFATDASVHEEAGGREVVELPATTIYDMIRAIGNAGTDTEVEVEEPIQEDLANYDPNDGLAPYEQEVGFGD